MLIRKNCLNFHQFSLNQTIAPTLDIPNLNRLFYLAINSFKLA